MYKVKNLRTGKFLKNAIDRKVFTYSTKEEAEIAAAGMNAFARANEKRDKYMIVTVS